MNDSPESPPESPSLTRRRRTFLAPLWLLAMAGVFMIAMAFAYWNSATTTTIVLVRHAEKQLGAISDAPLSPQGEVRASRLAQMFGDSEPFGRIDRIYVTNTRRTQQTSAGLAQRLGLNADSDRRENRFARARATRAAREPRRPRAHRRAQQHRAGNRRRDVAEPRTYRRSAKRNSTRCTSSPCPPSARCQCCA